MKHLIIGNSNIVIIVTFGRTFDNDTTASAEIITEEITNWTEALVLLYYGCYIVKHCKAHHDFLFLILLCLCCKTPFYFRKVLFRYKSNRLNKLVLKEA